MNLETIALEIKDSIGIITLNRPEAMNTWNAQLAKEVSNALKDLDDNDEVRSVILTGSGKAFCAGLDLGGAGQDEKAKGSSEDLGFPTIMPWQLKKPVIAAINGHAIGVGITYAMTCDIRFVAEEAKIQFAFVRRGILPELASHVIVPRVAGFSRAADLMLTGRIIKGKEFASMGLASKALPADQVLEEALKYAREFRQTAPVSVAISKKLLWQGLSCSADEMLIREFPYFAWTLTKEDAVEGIVSFLEKRDPDWKLKASSDYPFELDKENK